METEKSVVNATAFYDKEGASDEKKVSTLVEGFLDYARYEREFRCGMLKLTLARIVLLSMKYLNYDSKSICSSGNDRCIYGGVVLCIPTHFRRTYLPRN